MLAFCGHDCCSIDSNGRIKFSPRVIKDFDDKCRGDVVMHCLPEGGIAIYPEDIYLEMRPSRRGSCCPGGIKFSISQVNAPFRGDEQIRQDFQAGKNNYTSGI